jgi:hypothetical protein
MAIGYVVIGLLVAYAGWSLIKMLLRAGSAGIRSWIARATLFFVLMALVAGVALAPLPNKHRLLVIAPFLALGGIIVRFAKKRRPAQPPAASQKEPDINRMKRLN